MWSSGIELSLRPQPTCPWDQHKRNQWRGGGHHHIDNCALFFSLSATVCQTSATSSLLQSSQLNRQRKNTRLISSAMRIVSFSRFSRKMPSPSLLLLLVPAVALGQQLVRIPVYCNSYVLYRWREVVLCELRELVKKSSRKQFEVISCNFKDGAKDCWTWGETGFCQLHIQVLPALSCVIYSFHIYIVSVLWCSVMYWFHHHHHHDPRQLVWRLPRLLLRLLHLRSRCCWSRRW